MHVSSLDTPFPILYFTSPQLLYKYLSAFFNPFSVHSFPYTPLPPATIKTLSISMILSVALVCLVCFLDSIVDTMCFLPFYCICTIYALKQGALKYIKQLLTELQGEREKTQL